MRVVFLGNAAWSVASVEAIAASGHDLALVVTRAPRPGGRGNRPLPTPVSEAARRRGLPLEEVQTVQSGPGLDALAEAEPEVLAVVAYGEILPQTVLDLPSVAPVNVHFSVLPALRGAAPVQHALLRGMERTGVTTIRMDRGMDTGPILMRAEEPIRPDDDSGSLGDRLAVLGGRLLVATLDGLEAGRVTERPQGEGGVSFAPKLKAEDRIIDWSQPADQIVRRVRAMAPEPGATTTFRGKGLKVLRASWRAHHGPLAWKGGGRVVAIAPKDELAVLAGDWFVILEEVQPEGRRRMSGADFVRGYRPEPGERLGRGEEAGKPPG